jgi:Ca2+-binding EF-hand superfamily protein
MTPETNKCISHLLKMLLNCHYSCELIRKDLNQKRVNISKVFEFIAGLVKGKAINQEALLKFFEKYYFYPSKEDIENLMETFDRNKTGLINIKEFQYELNPKVL